MSRPAQIRSRLLAWYRLHHRKLPWRGTTDPYAVWISEVMLQQTRVATVLPYYDRFLRRFPTVEDLAAAPIQPVLAAWSGLGYYRRAHALHTAARRIVDVYGGKLPPDPATLRRLPSFGPYTAGAVASITFDLPEPAVDGNVARVISRMETLPVDAQCVAGRRRIEDVVRTWFPPRRTRGRRACGDLTQALMELGAGPCRPRRPECPRCPVTSLCRARREGRTGAFPPPRRRRPGRAKHRALALIDRAGKVLLVQRPSNAINAGLWEPPGTEPSEAPPGSDVLHGLLAEMGLAVEFRSPPRKFRHAILQDRITAQVHQGRVLRGRLRRGRWFSPEEAASLPLTAAAHKALAELSAPSRQRRVGSAPPA